MKILEFNNVWEKYRIKFVQEGNVYWEERWALENISFNVEKGEVVGVMGRNGAGKTTLLKLIAGMLIPDKGNISVEGKVSALMGLGAGFNPEFTGIENIKLNAALYGLSQESLREKMSSIVDFADLGDFINAPVKYYSQGMYMRLAFALAIFVEPDILLIDDILAVGDEETQQKCIKKIFELKESGKTIILVSHDMNMVSKLCSRAMLLDEGKIVKKGLPAKVISRYLETVGDRKGVAVLEKDKLRVIFNNGKLTIDYNGFYLTKPMGGYASFLSSFSNNWVSSSNLLWQIKELRDNELVAEGRYQEGNISQIWRLWLEDDCLKWQVEIKEKDIKQPHIDLLFIPQYKKWYTLEESKDFPFFASKYNWHDLGLISCPHAVLGISTLWQSQDYPGIILKHQDKSVLFRLFNTGYDQESRVIQWGLDPKSKNIISIRIFSEENKFTEYIRNIREELLRKQQQELAPLRRLHTISSGSLRLFADQENKVLRLYYKDTELTKAKGLHCSFNNSKESFGLLNAQWKIRKVTKERIILMLRYEQNPIMQIWDLRCCNNVLEIKVELKLNNQIFLVDEGVRLELIDEYKRWVTSNEEGNFSIDRYIDNIGPIRLKDNKISKVVLKAESKGCIPELMFDCHSQTENRILNLYKRKEKDFDCVGIYSAIITSRRKQLFPPGKYTYFEGRIVMDEKMELEERPKRAKVIELKSNSLSVVFDGGKGSIFWKNKELTSGLGIYTSVRSLGIWYDSYQAAWQVVQSRDSKIIAFGDWPHIPILQTWQIELIDKNLISWQVDMEIYEEINLEIEQANLMLSSEYKNWIAPSFVQGDFLDEYTEDYDILPFRFWYGKAKEVVAIAKSLPKIVFKSDMKNRDLKAIVENTDNLYRARLLQYQNMNKCKLLPSKYLYFKGVVEIEPKE